MMEKENECDCLNTIVENKLDINGDNEILSLMAYDGRQLNINFILNII